ncbi:hypothetical protein [Persephonella sp. IF05-L8]|uniref:hypothetical protein n=1 Tax=Persephonella sp. IF05-L8 TaxID=1158338 RepID=UPI0004980BD2
MSILSNDLSSEVYSLIEKVKEAIYKLHSFYEKDKDEDLLEVRILEIFNRLPRAKNILKTIMIEAIEDTDIPERNKHILKEIIEEAYLTSKIQEKLRNNTEIGELMEGIIDKCKSTNVKNSPQI